jgi:hypothetical protein
VTNKRFSGEGYHTRAESGPPVPHTALNPKRGPYGRGDDRFLSPESVTLRGYFREVIKHLFWQPRLRQEFPAPLFFGLCHVAAAIPHFVSFEVRTIDTFYRFGFLATGRQRAFIAVLRVEAVIHFAVELS